MTISSTTLRLCLLSAAAGCVDAVGFLASGVFPANMTGNSVMLGLALVRTDLAGVGLSGGVLAGFLAGAAAGGLALAGRPRGRWRGGVNGVLGVVALLLSGAALAVELGHERCLVPCLLAASVAMGLQGAAVLKLGVSGVSTTVVTGALTTGVVNAIERWKGPREGGEAVSFAPLGSWLAYAAGAAVGGLYDTRAGVWSFLAPGALLWFVMVAGLFRRR